MKRLTIALVLGFLLCLLIAVAVSAHTSETRVVQPGFCQIRYITIWTIRDTGEHGHLTYTPWYFFRCNW